MAGPESGPEAGQGPGLCAGQGPGLCAGLFGGLQGGLLAGLSGGLRATVQEASFLENKMAIKLYIKYVKEILDGIRISEGESLRTECPACNGSNTFTVTKSNGRLLWNCYRASCAIKGVSDDPNPSHSDLVSRANYRNKINTPSTKKLPKKVKGEMRKYDHNHITLLCNLKL